MDSFLNLWSAAATTTVGLFWMAFWAFALGYVISSMIQVFVTEKRMQETMGEAGAGSVALGAFFGFISSSCSFAALSTTRALFTKGAGLIPALAFLLASTNLVVELGIVIAVFLSWQFVVGEYLGGILLILIIWLVVSVFRAPKLEKQARQHARDQEGHDHGDGDSEVDWKKLIRRREGWLKVARRYTMEWDMVWKDVTIGFTVAGIISAFVPRSFFQFLFVGSGAEDPAFWQVVAQSIVGPVAAFFTFIGSMGNIPLAAVLFSNGVSFAGVMAFIFSDLVVFPVLRIQTKYYGWKMAMYILGIFLLAIVATSVLMHYGFSLAGLLPDAGMKDIIAGREFFKVNYTLFLNILFITLTVGAVAWKWIADGPGDGMGGSSSNTERILFYLSLLSYIWIAGGLVIAATMSPQ